MFGNLAIVIAFSLLIAGCALGPEYSRPSNHASQPSAYASSLLLAAEHSIVDQPISGKDAGHETVVRWWRDYNDPLLNAWVDQLIAENLNLKAAAERLVQAREQVSIQRAAWWPSLGLGSAGTRNFAPDLLNTSQRAYRSGTAVDGFISWQIDLFGRTRRAVESAEFGALASANDYRGLQQSLIAELITQRVVLALLDREIDIQQGISKSRDRTLETVSRRYELGVRNTSAVGVHVARENATTAQAQLSALRQQYREALLGIEILLNQRPGSLATVAGDFPLLPKGQGPDLGAPLMLLDQRPDIVGSELRLMAANAGIGVAMADLFPDLTLSASGGFSSDQWGGLLNNNNGAGQVAANITSRLFEGGRLRAQIRVRESELRRLSWEYAQTVLQAMVEVERALIQEQYLLRQVDKLQASAVAARQAEALSQERYQRGITSFLEVLETQRRRQNAERNLLAAQRASWAARINLHLALGGNWLGEDQPEEKTEDSS